MKIERNVGIPAAAYAGAPDLDIELAWLQESTRTPGFELSRKFWLRRAAFLDRLALREAGSYGLEATVPLIRTAEMAGSGLVVYDIAHSGLSPKGSDLVVGEDHRAYVREEYRASSLG
ncbi:hypothetical protein OG369_16170 [Streptomyces sp. NBC_01221]|uniref:hypothetical protein n=1 Tax=Streptomyces sp. NBC_01221 TaxID=2903782 RepID=UPI0022530BD2|nr:hypothetical protein [Streptomyces sp. NBC_01221]MCX4787665.1 hypothetical protein [Streptomyces sp. NBC_01221]